MNDRTTLDDLDQRASAAAADLHARAAARPRPAFDPEAATTLAPPRPLAGGPGARPTQRPLLVAAAAAVLALVGAAVWATARSGGGDGRPADQVTTGSNRPFLAGDGLPDGFRIIGAAETRPPATGSGAAEAGPLTVYGPSDTEPRLGVAVVGGPWADDQSGDPITVRGRSGRFREDAFGPGLDLLQLSLGADPSSGPTLLLVGRRIQRGELERIAAATAVDGLEATVADEDLPPGWHRLGSSPEGIVGLMPVAALRGVSGAAAYFAVYDDGNDEAEIALTIQSQAAPTGIDPSLLVQQDVTSVTIRGHAATVGRVESGGGPGTSAWIARWEERAGEVLTVSGLAVTREQVLAVAEGVRPATAAEWKDLIHRTQLGDFDPNGTNGVELGRGELADGTPWVLRAVLDGDTVSSVDLDVAISGDSSSGSSGSSVGQAVDENGNPLPVEPTTFDHTSTMETAGRAFAYGLVDPTAERVEIQGAPGTTPIEAEVVRSGGRAGWVAELTGSLIGGSGQVVALDVDGRELGRADLLSTGSSGGSSGSGPTTTGG